MRERSVESYLKRQIELRGGICWKFLSPGNAGVPDRLVVFNSQLYLVELKAPGRKPRQLQLATFSEFTERGVPVYILDSQKAVDDFISEVSK